MKIGLIGYGKMGKAIEKIALERGHEIVFKSDSQHPLSTIDISSVDVAIEFTQPDLAVEHILYCLGHNVPVVVGTTAWQKEHLKDIEGKVAETNGSLLHASNFSVGVNILFHINERLAKIMSKQLDYTPQIEEIHHVQKLDSPSGTAVSIAEGIIANHDAYHQWKSDEGTWPVVHADELAILAKREPNVPGTHTIAYNSTIDTLTLTHVAHNRDGFALGAVVAAEFLKDKKGCFTMRDVLAF